MDGLESPMAFHVVRMIAAVGFLVFCTFYPYLPGEFDGLAVTLSVMAQAGGLVGMAVVAVGLPWLVHEVRRPAASDRSHRSHTYRYAVASVIAGSLVALTASLAASTSGRAFGLVTLGLWGYTVWRCVPALRRLKHAEPDGSTRCRSTSSSFPPPRSSFNCSSQAQPWNSAGTARLQRVPN